MKKLITVISLIVISFTAYSQDTAIEILTKRDGGSRILITIEDYGNSTYVSMSSGGDEVTTTVTSWEDEGNLFTYYLSFTDGSAVLFLNIETLRFTVKMSNGTSYNGDILTMNQTI